MTLFSFTSTLAILILPFLVKSCDCCHQYVSHIIFPDDYNSQAPPIDGTDVLVAFDIMDVSKVEQDNIIATMVIMTTWNDSRLAFDGKEMDVIAHIGIWPAVHDRDRKRLWHPVLRFSQMKKQEPLVSGSELTRDIRITGDADLKLYSEILSTVTIKCPMDVSDFPYDEHECFFEGYLPEHQDTIHLKQDEIHGEPSWGRILSLPSNLEFDVTFSDLPDSRRVRKHSYFKQNYTLTYRYVGFVAYLVRKPTAYIINYYLPSGLFVVVSWSSFIIPPQAVPGRIVLLLTSFLSLVNIANSAFSSSPVANGINYMQVWILSCMGFVFIAVLEYVSMLYLMRFALKKPTLPRRPRKNLLQTHPTTSAEEDGLMRAGRIDKCTLFLMPSVFLLFNVWYWTLF